MLSELHISNFAIIDQQSVTFGPGLNVISGETGSGKSIVLGAIELIQGEKSSTQLIRSGEESLEVSALFDLSTLAPELVASLPDAAQGEELLISRSLNRSGKGKVYINGRLGSVSLLQEVTSRLVNLCGQNQHIRLLNQKYHAELIDDFAGHDDLLARYREIYGELRSVEKTLAQHELDQGAALKRREELEEIVAELEPLKIRAGERAELEAEVKRLTHSEALIKGCSALVESFDADEGVGAQLHHIGAELHELGRLDPELAQLANAFVSARTDLIEFQKDLARYAGRLNVDEEKLEELRERLAAIAAVERKYRSDEAALLALLTQASQELGAMSSGGSLAALRKRRTELKNALDSAGEGLTRSRERAGERLAKLIAKELADLAMAGVTIAMKREAVEPGPDGFDRIELLISTTKGEPHKPLRLIASGGELARITLVLKKVLRDRSGVNVLVFDEVDTGISGGVARAVGEKLKELARGSQVICITHLAQVASLADTHLLVSKSGRNRAICQIQALKGEQKVDEIARMLAGYTITPAARESARELLSSKSQ